MERRMTYDRLEESSYSSIPVVLFKFSRGAVAGIGGQVWRYTSADQDILMAENLGPPISFRDPEVVTYTAYPISHAGITLSGEPSTDQLVITLPWSAPVVSLFRGDPPSVPVAIEVSYTHFGDPSAFDFAAGDPARRLMWVGTISQVKRTDPGKAELTCNTIAQSFERNGLRLGWARNCPYSLYDPKTCKADKTLHSLTGLITQLSFGFNVTVAEFAGFPDGAFKGGYIEWLAAVGEPSAFLGGELIYERRVIQGHSGPTVRILGTTEALSVGQSITGYRGCDKTITMCDDIFANIDNNGSCPYLPGISPFDGRLIF
jgi:uncharacterized phage protein (TIGR02218 family)